MKIREIMYNVVKTFRIHGTDGIVNGKWLNSK